MSASRFDFDHDEAVSMQRDAERGGPDQRREALNYWIEATSSANHAPTEVRLLAGEQMPSLLRDFPEALQEVYEAGCDLSEDDSSEEVRMAGYRCMVMVAAQDSSFAGQVADVLLQLYRDTLEYKTSPTEESALDGSLRSVLLSNPKSALQSFFYMIESGTPDQQKLLWDFLDGKAGKDLESLWKKERWDDVQGEFIQELFHAIPLADENSRPICLALLSQLPLCTGDRAATADREYYAQLVCEEALTDPNDLENFGRCLQLLTPAYDNPKEAQPDPRWPLLLFNHNPDQVHLWAKSKPGAAAEEGPSRLMNWTARGYVKMRDEIKDPSLAEGVPEYFGMRSLGADLCKASLMFMLALLPSYQTVETVRRCMQDIELYLLVSYFLWLKFNDRIPNLMDEADKEKLLQVARFAEARSSLESEPDSKRRLNVATMCRNLAKTGHATEADKVTVYPSWKPTTERSRAAQNASARAAAIGGADAGHAVTGLSQEHSPVVASDEMDVDPSSLAPPPSESSRRATEAMHPNAGSQSRPIPTGPRSGPPVRKLAGSMARTSFPNNNARHRQVAPLQNAAAGPSSQRQQTVTANTSSKPLERASPSPSSQTPTFSIHGHASRSSPITESFAIAGIARANSPITQSNGSSPSGGLSIIGSGAKRKRANGMDELSGAGPMDVDIVSFNTESNGPGMGGEQRPSKRGKPSLADRITPANTGGSLSLPTRPSLERIDDMPQNGNGGTASVPTGPRRSLLERMQGGAQRVATTNPRPPATMLPKSAPVRPLASVPHGIPPRPVKQERADRTHRPSLRDRIHQPGSNPIPGPAVVRPPPSRRPILPPRPPPPHAQLGGVPSASKFMPVRQYQSNLTAQQLGISGPAPAIIPSTLHSGPEAARQAAMANSAANGIRCKGRGFALAPEGEREVR